MEDVEELCLRGVLQIGGFDEAGVVDHEVGWPVECKDAGVPVVIMRSSIESPRRTIRGYPWGQRFGVVRRGICLSLEVEQERSLYLDIGARRAAISAVAVVGVAVGAFGVAIDAVVIDVVTAVLLCFLRWGVWFLRVVI
jgi:hypothetical protein